MPPKPLTAQELETAICVLSTYDGCMDVVCADVLGENCECARIIKRMFEAVAKVAQE